MTGRKRRQLRSSHPHGRQPHPGPRDLPLRWTSHERTQVATVAEFAIPKELRVPAWIRETTYSAGPAKWAALA
eukprot:2823312-Pyramimonas_sp.AAC.1